MALRDGDTYMRTEISSIIADFIYHFHSLAVPFLLQSILVELQFSTQLQDTDSVIFQ